MSEFSRMPRYDIRNDGAGPYGVFYCDLCGREFRSQPDVIGTVGQDIGRQAAGGLLRKIPIFGGAVADKVTGEDPRYSYKMTPAQLDKAWGQVQEHFRQCPTCTRIVCLSDFDTQAGFCQEDSPRTDEIAEARGQQAGAAIKGFAAALGLGGIVENASAAADAAQRATTQMARCPKDGTLAAFGLAVAVLLDATIVRAVLVPSTMVLLGKANWYLPSWLNWLPDLREREGREEAVAANGQPAQQRGATGGAEAS